MAEKRTKKEKQEAFRAFLIRMEQEGRSFTMEEIEEQTGYPLKGTVKAKISRSEWKNVIERLGANEFKALPVKHLGVVEFARLLSVKRMHEDDITTYSGKLMDKSLHAALSAIEIYNKPDFKYREESIGNGWKDVGPAIARKKVP